MNPLPHGGVVPPEGMLWVTAVGIKEAARPWIITPLSGPLM